MVLRRTCDLAQTGQPLELADLPIPEPAEGEILVKVAACGVCHTDLDIMEGRTPPARLPLIPGHQIVGRVRESAGGGRRFPRGTRVGIAWIFSACGHCSFCLSGQENLCDGFRATGRDVDGGYAEYTVVPEASAFSLPDVFTDEQAAPLLCAGAIGYRSLRLSGLRDGDALGLVGFGASGHLVLKMVRHRYPAVRIFVFSRTEAERDFGRELGAVWAGDFGETAPEKLRCAIDTTPAWRPVIGALRNLERGGRLVINAIRKEERDRQELLQLDYARDLWMEKEIKSVANITRQDVEEFLWLAAQVPILPEVQTYPLEEANTALLELRERKIRGAKVLLMPPENR
jgi:propanol-preferring alcohol dehydrogenase